MKGENKRKEKIKIFGTILGLLYINGLNDQNRE